MSNWEPAEYARELRERARDAESERDALKLDNERLREALQKSTVLLECIIRAKGEDWFGYPVVERLITESRAALAPATPTQEPKS